MAPSDYDWKRLAELETKIARLERAVRKLGWLHGMKEIGDGIAAILDGNRD